MAPKTSSTTSTTLKADLYDSRQPPLLQMLNMQFQDDCLPKAANSRGILISTMQHNTRTGATEFLMELDMEALIQREDLRNLFRLLQIVAPDNEDKSAPGRWPTIKTAISPRQYLMLINYLNDNPPKKTTWRTFLGRTSKGDRPSKNQWVVLRNKSGTKGNKIEITLAFNVLPLAGYLFEFRDLANILDWLPWKDSEQSNELPQGTKR